MANTFTLIASSTVGVLGAASIDFTSIPSTYTDLCLKVSARGTATANTVNCYATFNSSASGYTDRLLYGNGSVAGSLSNISTTSLFIGDIPAANYTANTFSGKDTYIPNYAGSTYKSVSLDNVTENNATASYAELDAGLWSNTAAITSISLSVSSGNFAQYSTAYLYGVKNA